MNPFDNLITRSIRRSLRLLPPSFKRRGILMLAGIFVNSIVDLVGLAALLPLFAAVLQEGFIEKNEILSYLFTTLGFTEERWFILFLCVLSFGFILFKNAFGLWRTKEQMNFVFDAYQHVSLEMYKAVYMKGHSYFADSDSHKIQNQIVNLPQGFSQLLLLSLLQFISELMIVFLIIASLIFYDPTIVFILVGITLPIFLIFYRRNKNKITEYQKKIHDINPARSKSVYELVFGYMDVAIGNVFEYFKQKYEEFTRQSLRLQKKLAVLQQIPARLIEIGVFITLILILIYGNFMLNDPSKIVAMLTVLGLATYRAVPSVNRLFLSFIIVRQQEFRLNLLEDLLPLEASENDRFPIEFTSSLEMQNVTFNYPNSSENIIANFSLKLSKGEALGLVGMSGSGKTTVLNLLLGFLRPTEGRILIDGVLLNDKNLAAWQAKLGYVRQDVFLVDGSIIENIAFGISTNLIDHVKLKRVIEQAQLTNVVDSLPNQLNTNIGERGSKLSGGQRQRIGIARALYRGAEVLFFDEATSALDTQTELDVTEAIHSLKKDGLTIVIISHRESALKFCDRVIRIGKE